MSSSTVNTVSHAATIDWSTIDDNNPVTPPSPTHSSHSPPGSSPIVIPGSPPLFNIQAFLAALAKVAPEELAHNQFDDPLGLTTVDNDKGYLPITYLLISKPSRPTSPIIDTPDVIEPQLLKDAIVKNLPIPITPPSAPTTIPHANPCHDSTPSS